MLQSPLILWHCLMPLYDWNKVRLKIGVLRFFSLAEHFMVHSASYPIRWGKGRPSAPISRPTSEEVSISLNK
jgi:hypothetical protein